MNKELLDFAARLRHSIASGFQKGDFDSLALELFALQFENNSAYRKICEARKLSPKIVEHWTRIPFVPASAFKELEFTSLAQNERTAVFHSSGTTEQQPSRHFHCAESLTVYELSLWNWFEQSILNSAFSIQNSELICLTPPPEQTPNSSLVHMFGTIQQKIGGASQNNFFGKISGDGSWILDSEALLSAINSKFKTQNSKLIFGTAFSFVHLLDYLAEHNLRLQLPTGSRVMETGGYKNRSRSMPKEALHSLIEKFLDVPRKNIICEYGMSELSSQAYANAGGEFQFPPWARVQIISPEAGHEVADGKTGLICVCDLANVFSVAPIQTEDMGIRRGEGFELIGRAQLAEPRGCSLMTA